MNKGRYVFTQICDFIPRDQFEWFVKKYEGNKYVKTFTCWNHLLVLVFGQLTNRESLRDLVGSLNAHKSKFHHLGFGKSVTRSNLSKANEIRDVRIFEDMADQIIRFDSAKTRKQYDEPIRRVVFYDTEGNRTFVFYTNNMEISAEDVARLYLYRWRVELFFKWLKQHLRIKEFYGTSENAVKIQIYSAIITYCLVAIVEHDMHLEMDTYELLRILSFSVIDRVYLVDLLKRVENEPNYQNVTELTLIFF